MTQHDNQQRLIRIATAGSVDNGKSTLIGRILYDTDSLPSDRKANIELQSRIRGYDYIDYSLATDGLMAEREQGITIDVAHLYFSYEDTAFIVADTPGHVEYTRNMITGASRSDVALIMVDARDGINEQTRRHFSIASQLRMQHVFVVINKMDLVGYQEKVFSSIKQSFSELILNSHFTQSQVTFVPVSALRGDNLVKTSPHMPWYDGDALLDAIRHLDLVHDQSPSLRFQVQFVVRPKTHSHPDFRGYCGRVAGGPVHVGEKVTVLPSMQQTHIKGISFFEESFDRAEAGQSVCITLKDDLDLRRGDMIVSSASLPSVTKSLQATVCQVDKKPLLVGEKLLLQHGVHRVRAKVNSIEHFSGPDKSSLELNEMAKLKLALAEPVFCDLYQDSRDNGSFVLIDEQSTNTVSVGMIE